MTDSLLAARRSPELLSRDDTQLGLIDMQEKLLAAMSEADAAVKNCSKLLQAAKLFEVPVTATEQYPKGLGSTVEELSQHLTAKPVEKLRFSAIEAFPDLNNPESPGRSRLVLCGIETHVCVLQTALDLLACGYRVYVAADAVTSRNRLDWEIGLQRLSDSDVVITTTESVLFEWCEKAGSDQFRALSKIVTER